MVIKETGTCYPLNRGVRICRSYICSQRSTLALHIIGEVFQPLTEPVTLYSDSQSAITCTKYGLYHARTKHIDIRYHFIRFVVQNKSIKLIYCPTEDMTADILTKALPNIKAKHFAKALGLHST